MTVMKKVSNCLCVQKINPIITSSWTQASLLPRWEIVTMTILNVIRYAWQMAMTVMKKVSNWYSVINCPNNESPFLYVAPPWTHVKNWKQRAPTHRIDDNYNKAHYTEKSIGWNCLVTCLFICFRSREGVLLEQKLHIRKVPSRILLASSLPAIQKSVVSEHLKPARTPSSTPACYTTKQQFQRHQLAPSEWYNNIIIAFGLQSKPPF